MAVKSPTRFTVPVDVHAPAGRPGTRSTPDTPHGLDSGRWPSIRNYLNTDTRVAAAELDAILPAPAASPGEQPVTVTLAQSHSSLGSYAIHPAAALPKANAEGFRLHKGRRYVDMPDGSVTQVALDPETGAYRARLPNERVASGPTLIRDPDSGLWHPYDDIGEFTFVPSESRLQPLRAEVDWRNSMVDDDGLFRVDGKVYVVIDNHTYQVMHDLDASTPEQGVWRIVKPGDSVAADPANIYHASRSGETLAITRNAQRIWVSTLPGLKGGMRRNQQGKINKNLLLQRSKPIEDAHSEMGRSAELCNSLWIEAQQQPEASWAKTSALIAVEVQLRKHVKIQADLVQSYIDNKDWLILMKAGGLYKTELHTLQIERVDYLNRLMATMDLRIRSTVTDPTVEDCRKAIDHLNKKLIVLNDRLAVEQQIKKAKPDAAVELNELNFNVPGVDQVNCSKLTMYLRLLFDNPENPPTKGMQALRAIHLLTNDLQNVPEQGHPLALMLAADQIRADRHQLESLVPSATAEKADYIKEIVGLISSFEQKIENRLNTLYATFERSAELPTPDQDIDFDFIPNQSMDAGSSRPSAPRKIFRTRQHGAYKVLTGETETTEDGHVTLKVSDPVRPNSPPLRYEKRQGEWLQVRPAIISRPLPELISEANRLLAKAPDHLTEAQAREARKDNPTDILETLESEAERLTQQIMQLDSHAEAGKTPEIIDLTSRLRATSDSLSAAGQSVLVRMYKNRDVLDVLRLNFLIEHDQLSVVRTVERKPLGKGKKRSFLDVYSIRDRSTSEPLWEAHFHYDNKDSAALNFNVKGGHLKTLEQATLGASSQKRDEQAGLPHVAIWRETVDGKTARKIFDLAA